MTSSPAQPATLEDALQRAATLSSAPLEARLQWLKDVIDAAEREDLGERGAKAVLDLKAALGAVVAWTRAHGDVGPQSDESIVELDALMRSLIARGTSGLYVALGETWRAIAEHRMGRAACIALATAFEDAAGCIAKGEAIPQHVVDRIQSAREHVSR